VSGIKETKCCTSCGLEKPLEDFGMGSSGRKASCKPCCARQQGAYRGAHPGYQRAWENANPGYHRARHANISAKRAGVPGHLTEADVMGAFNAAGGDCCYCGEKLQDGWNIDHVVPMSRGGNNTSDNIVACCHSCNSRKQSKLPEQFAAQIGAAKGGLDVFQVVAGGYLFHNGRRLPRVSCEIRRSQGGQGRRVNWSDRQCSTDRRHSVLLGSVRDEH